MSAAQLVHVDGLAIEARVDGPDGAGAGAKPWIVLSNGLGTTFGMWDLQIETLTRTHRVLRTNMRGHGRTDAPAGPYAMTDLMADLLGVMDHFEIARADMLGLSLGGVLALNLGLDHPERVGRILCCDARADAAPAFLDSWDTRIAAVAAQGMEPVVAGTVERWLTSTFRAAHPAETAATAAMLRATDPVGYMGCARALQTHGVMARLGAMTPHVLYVVGSEDAGAPPDIMRAMAAATRHADFIEIPAAAHVPPIDAAEAFNALLVSALGAGARDGTATAPAAVA